MMCNSHLEGDKMVKCHTQARTLFTKKQIVTIFWPLALENLLSVLMGLLDIFMVSVVGEVAISSVSLVNTVNSIVDSVLLAFAAGGAIVVSQCLQARQNTAKKCAAQIFSILLTFTAALTAIVFVGNSCILRLAFGQVEEDVMASAQIYFLVSAASYPFMGAYHAGVALFRAQGDSKTGMKAGMAMNVINVIGNVLLICVLHMGVLGAAIATLIGRVFSALWVLIQQQKNGNLLRIESTKDFLFKKEYVKPILAMSIPNGVENGVYNFGRVCVSSLTSTLSTAAIAAYSVVDIIGELITVPSVAARLAVMPVVGQCLGIGEKMQAKYYVRLLTKVATAGLVITCPPAFIFSPQLTSLFSLSEEAAGMCVSGIRIACVVCIFLPVSGYVVPAALRTGGDTMFVMTVSVCSMWLCRVLLANFVVIKLGMGLSGIWLGRYADWACRAVVFRIRLLSGKWMEHKVI